VRVQLRRAIGGPGDQTIAVRGAVTTPGLRYYRVWYRNAANYCTTQTFNLTNGLAVTWGV
jgi:hypothetical protein